MITSTVEGYFLVFCAGPYQHCGKRLILLEWVEAEPDIMMPELAAKLKAEKDVTVHPASFSRVLLQAGLSFKKKPAGLGGQARGCAPGA